ncbi:MAG TPA: GspH/FimT family pseudopilin [Burkholderiales bacterium]|nr:GspH/FimT family pseudopilin [Burkholderiales bacterium]
MKGFTLVEILAVLAVAAVVALAAVVAVRPDPVGRAQSEAQRLAALFELAHAEAGASGRAMAWIPQHDGYAFVRAGADGGWEALDADGPFRARSLPAGLKLRGSRFVLSARGLHAPAQAVISGSGATFMVRSGSLGQTSVQRLHAD